MKTILLVEDNLIEQQIVCMLAAKAGVRVETASTAYKAITLLESDEHHYEAVLMNYMLPAMDGVECTKHIRSLGGSATSIPIIAFTALVTEEVRELCLAAGMDDYLGKPYTPEEFNTVLHRWVGDTDEPGH